MVGACGPEPTLTHLAAKGRIEPILPFFCVAAKVWFRETGKMAPEFTAIVVAHGAAVQLAQRSRPTILQHLSSIR